MSDRSEPRLVPHFRDLDGIRGVLAVAVMCYHYGIDVIFNRLTGGFVTHSGLGLSVDFFFVLSGLVLARSYLRRPRNFAQRFVERIFRLLPLHLVLMGALSVLFILAPGQQAFFGAHVEGVAGYLAQLASVSVLFGLHRWNDASWTIGYELYIPIVLAVFLPALQRTSGPVRSSLCAVLAVVEMTLLWAAFAQAGAFDIYRGLMGLALGGALNLVILPEKPLIELPSTRFALPALLLVSLGLMVFVQALPLLAPVIAALFILTVALGTRSSSFLGRGVFAWLGRISFSVYLVHQPLRAWVYYAMGTESFDGRLAIKVMLIAAVLALATLLQRMVEQPFIRVGKRIAARLGTSVQVSERPVGASPD